MPAGRPQFKVTDEVLKKVEKFASLGLTEAQIARNLGIARQTLISKKKQYSEFLDAIERGKAKGISMVSNAVFDSAMAGNVSNQQFYLKCRAPDQWKEKQALEHTTGDEGFNITITSGVDDCGPGFD